MAGTTNVAERPLPLDPILGRPPSKDILPALEKGVEPIKCEGVVARWDDEGGFGFIKPTKPPGQPEAFVGRSGLGGGGIGGKRLVAGEVVFYDAVPSDRPGRMVAMNLTGPGVQQGEGNRAAQVGGPQEGIVSRWDEERGYGFITPAVGGQDAFVRRTCFGGKGQLIDGLAVFFEAEIGLSARGQQGLRASNVSGPAVLNRAEEYRVGDTVMYREGTDCILSDERGLVNVWKLPAGQAATVVKVVGDQLILDNGQRKSQEVHAALWWRRAFVRIAIGEEEVPRQDNLEATLGMTLGRTGRITKVDTDGPGYLCGLRERYLLRWVGQQEVTSDKEAEEAFKNITGDLYVVFLIGQHADRLDRSRPSTLTIRDRDGGRGDRRDRDRRDGDRDRREDRDRRDRDRRDDRDRDRDRRDEGSRRRRDDDGSRDRRRRRSRS
eukprot:TRINITY_DN1819_c0_g2_i1.p2 TRINITY_DN1819_c0_g2~~TRINITY_DN1819_c0_g2_i1.p2  ORF type:complete len:467 (+),score=151.06 TRINITY_DN1819_c0_g2_i1:95-1402(+)